MAYFDAPALAQATSLLRQLQEKLRELATLPAIVVIGGFACGVITVYGSYWLGFLLLAATLYVAIVVRMPHVGVLGVIGVLYLLPFGVIPVPVGTLRLTLLDLGLSFALVVALISSLARPQQGFIFSPLGTPIVLFLGLAGVAFLFGIASVSAEIFRFFLKTVNSVLFFFTVINCLRPRQEIEQVASTIILGVGVAATTAVVLYFLPMEDSFQLLTSLGQLGYPTSGAGLRSIADTQILRATGTAIDPNALGGMLMIALPLVIRQLLERQPVLPRILLGAIFLAASHALLLTYSRGAWFGALAGICFLAAVRYRRLWLWIGLMLGLLFILPQSNLILERFRSGLLFADRAAQMRLGEYQDALRLISHYPLFGVGFGEAPSLDLYVATSSIYLLMAEEMGLVGLGAFLLVVGVLFWQMRRARERARQQGLDGIQLGALAGVVGALSAGLFDHYFFNLQFPHTVALFWLFVGLAVATVSQRELLEAAKADG